MTVAGPNPRSDRGLRSHLTGQAAEDQVERCYLRQGMILRARRWRGKYGEIDLVFQHDARLIFVEVKSSHSHARAAEHVSPAQVHRIFHAAVEFLETEPNGQLTDFRVDVGLVDGAGRIEIIENAFAG